MRRGSGHAVDWTFGGLWPYQPRWFHTVDGRMHYIDEGPRDGRPVVLVHGNPTWGFLYRRFVGPLVAAGHRVIVPDHLGFGRSDPPADAEACSLQRHVDRMEALLESLDLHDATVVPHDWGGPIALSWAAAHPDRIAGLFILNTTVHVPPQGMRIPLVLRVVRARGLGDVLVGGLGLVHHGFLFRVGVRHRERLTPAVREAYLAPHPTWRSRRGVVAFPRQIPLRSGGRLEEVARRIERGLRAGLADRPVHIAWGMHDPGFPGSFIDDLWLQTFPAATVTRLDDSGHFVQEDAHEQVIPELLAHLDRTKAGGT